MGNKKGSKRVGEVKINTTIKALTSKKLAVMNKAKEQKDGMTLGKLFDKAMDDYLAR